MVQYREAVKRQGGENRERERDKHTALTLMCLWDTNKERVRGMQGFSGIYSIFDHRTNTDYVYSA